MTESTEISRQALLDAAQGSFEERIPFNRVLGLRIEHLGESDVVVRFDMRDELVGNFTRGSLHGGVISSVLDVVGGLVAFIALLNREGVQSLEDEADKFSRLGTIDLRVDYLRPGLGEDLFCQGICAAGGSQSSGYPHGIAQRRRLSDCGRNGCLQHILSWLTPISRF